MEHFPRPETQPRPDQNIVEMLGNPEIQKGLTITLEKIDNYYSNLENNGKTVNRLVRGITIDGNCVDVAEEITDSPNNFTIFVYPLQDVISPNFTDNLAPRTYDKPKITSGITFMDVYDTDDPDGSLKAQYEEGLREKLRNATERDEFDQINNIYQTSLERDNIVIKTRDEGPHTFGAKPIISFEEAAYGEKRQEITDAEVSNLKNKSAQHQGAAKNALSANNSRTHSYHHAAAEELASRARATINSMKENPIMVDIPGIVHDAAKAEHIARNINTVMSKSIKVKDESTRDDYLREANIKARQAELEYESDPMVFGVSTKKESKGLLGRFRQK